MLARVSLRSGITRIITAVAILGTAVTSVGLTAPSDSPFSLRIRPVLLRFDPAALAESRAHAFGLDVDVKLGDMHLHAGWSAIPLLPASTNPGANRF